MCGQAEEGGDPKFLGQFYNSLCMVVFWMWNMGIEHKSQKLWHLWGVFASCTNASMGWSSMGSESSGSSWQLAISPRGKKSSWINWMSCCSSNLHCVQLHSTKSLLMLLASSEVTTYLQHWECLIYVMYLLPVRWAYHMPESQLRLMWVYWVVDWWWAFGPKLDDGLTVCMASSLLWCALTLW